MQGINCVSWFSINRILCIKPLGHCAEIVSSWVRGYYSRLSGNMQMHKCLTNTRTVHSSPHMKSQQVCWTESLSLFITSPCGLCCGGHKWNHSALLDEKCCVSESLFHALIRLKVSILLLSQVKWSAEHYRLPHIPYHHVPCHFTWVWLILLLLRSMAKLSLTSLYVTRPLESLRVNRKKKSSLWFISTLGLFLREQILPVGPKLICARSSSSLGLKPILPNSAHEENVTVTSSE